MLKPSVNNTSSGPFRFCSTHDSEWLMRLSQHWLQQTNIRNCRQGPGEKNEITRLKANMISWRLRDPWTNSWENPAGHPFELSSSEAECAGWKRGSGTSPSSPHAGLRTPSAMTSPLIPLQLPLRVALRVPEISADRLIVPSAERPPSAVGSCCLECVCSACQPPTGFLPEDDKKKKNNQTSCPPLKAWYHLIHPD